MKVHVSKSTIIMRSDIGETLSITYENDVWKGVMEHNGRKGWFLYPAHVAYWLLKNWR